MLARIHSAVAGARVSFARPFPAFWTRTAGARSHRPRQGLANPHQTVVVLVRRPDAPAAGQGHLGAAVHPADHVVADVDHGLRSLPHGEERVEARHSENLGRGNSETARDMVQAARTDPARAVLEGMEGGKQQTAPLRSSPILTGHSGSAVGRDGLGFTEYRVHGLPFSIRGHVGGEVKIHAPTLPI